MLTNFFIVSVYLYTKKYWPLTGKNSKPPQKLAKPTGYSCLALAVLGGVYEMNNAFFAHSPNTFLAYYGPDDS